MNNTIIFDTVPNFRDMGGYKTNSGKQVKRGLFYRSAALGKMTAQDQQRFQQLGIKTIFDYRDDYEAAKNPDPIFEGIENIRIPAKQNILAMPSTDNTQHSAQQFYQQMTPTKFADMYADMAFDNPSFQKLMAVATTPAQLGLLHHCAIGKDRTGIGGAMILMALDVPKETIFEDYLKTNSLLQATIDQMAANVLSDASHEELQQFYALMAAKEEYLQAVFDGIDTRYETTASFLLDQFQLHPHHLQEMHDFALV